MSHTEDPDEDSDANAGIEAIVDGDVVTVRNPERSDGPALHFPRNEWDAFVAGVRAGGFDIDDVTES